MQRPSYLSSASTNIPPRRQPSFTQSKGSSTLSTPVWGPPATTQPPEPPKRSSKGPSLSLALGGSTTSDHHNLTEEIHPLKYTWDVYFSQRGAGMGKKNKNNEGEGKESREEWEGTVVKLGGFSSIESLHPFLAHLTPPSQLPSSIHTSSTLFSLPPPPSPPTQSNLICDFNLFRSPIAPMWEDPANTGGGRWVLRLRKGVADRIWEEVIWALVGERIVCGGESGKVNGAVLSVRKDEDILSVWCAPASRPERDGIRDSLKVALEPILSPTALSALQLDYKPHPVASSTTRNANNNNNAVNNTSHPINSESIEPRPHTNHSHSHHNGGGGGGGGGGRRDRENGGRERGPGANVGRGFGGYRAVDGDEVGEERRERPPIREREKSGTGGIVWGRTGGA